VWSALLHRQSSAASADGHSAEKVRAWAVPSVYCPIALIVSSKMETRASVCGELPPNGAFDREQPSEDGGWFSVYNADDAMSLLSTERRAFLAPRLSPSMDVEYRLPLLRWVDSAASPQLRQAVQACSQHQATQLLTQAVARSVAVAVPTMGAEVAANLTDSAASVDSMLAIPSAARSHITKFVEDTVESLAQLTSYLLTEQVSAEEKARVERSCLQRFTRNTFDFYS
jgi:hypothetical protein